MNNTLASTRSATGGAMITALARIVAGCGGGGAPTADLLGDGEGNYDLSVAPQQHHSTALVGVLFRRVHFATESDAAVTSLSAVAAQMVAWGGFEPPTFGL